MWSNVFSSLESLFLQFNVKRLFYWLTLIAVLVGVLLVGERLTGFIYFWQIDRKIKLTSELLNLYNNGIQGNQELNLIYEDLVTSIRNYKPSSISISLPSAQLTSLESIFKFISGGFLGFMVALSGYSDRKDPQKTGWKSTVYGGLFFGIVFALIGVVIPTIANPWVNYVSYPIVEIIVILGLSKLLTRRKT